jgi:hypothetical protein
MKIQIPENIHLNDLEHAVLTFRVHPEQIAFALYDRHDPAVFFYHSVEGNKHASAFAAFQDIFFENDFFSLPFKEVRLINHTSTFTYIPSLIFEDKDKETYMRFLFTETTDKILSHSIRNQGITVIHTLPENVYDFFHRSFSGMKIVHHTAPLITYFQKKNRTVDGNRLIVLLQGSGMDILCFSRETLLLANYFHWKEIQDVVYYILFTWKQLKFDQLHDFAYVAGADESKQTLIGILTEYFQQVLPVDIASEAHFEQTDPQVVPYELLSLFLNK